MGKRYRTFFFDLDDTILDYTGDEKRAIRFLMEKYNIPFSSDVYDLYYSIDDWQIFTMGNITAENIISDHFLRMLKMLQVGDIRFQMASEFYKCMLNSHKIKPGALGLLRWMKKEGYRIYLTTNGYSEFQRKRIKDAKIQNLFDGIFISEEIDLRKPSRSFFDYVMNRVPESNRSNVLIVGDAPTADILGGINCGINTCWINPDNNKCKYKYTYQIKKIGDLRDILTNSIK